MPPGVTKPGRVRAINRLLEQFRNQPNVQVALVPFETNVKGVWPLATAGEQHFARPNDDLTTRVNTLQAELGKGTDYQGALASAYGIVASDINATSLATPDLLPRTRYIVVFLTDGTPFPRCSAEDDLIQYADDLHPDLPGPTPTARETSATRSSRPTLTPSPALSRARIETRTTSCSATSTS